MKDWLVVVAHLPASDNELYDVFIALAHGAEHSNTVLPCSV